MDKIVSKEYVIVENIDIVNLKRPYGYFELFDCKFPPRNKLHPNIVWEKDTPVYNELIEP